MTPAWPWALALTIALGALIVSQVQLHEARERRSPPAAGAAVRRDPVGAELGAVGMTDEDYLTAVLNCDDQSGMATDAAWRAVSALRGRAERAEAEVQRLHRVIAESLPYIDFAEQFSQAEAAIQRVRELAEFWKAQVADSPSGASWVYMSAASRLLLDALDGPDE